MAARCRGGVGEAPVAGARPVPGPRGDVAAAFAVAAAAGGDRIRGDGDDLSGEGGADVDELYRWGMDSLGGRGGDAVWSREGGSDGDTDCSLAAGLIGGGEEGGRGRGSDDVGARRAG